MWDGCEVGRPPRLALGHAVHTKPYGPPCAWRQRLHAWLVSKGGCLTAPCGTRPRAFCHPALGVPCLRGKIAKRP